MTISEFNLRLSSSRRLYWVLAVCLFFTALVSYTVPARKNLSAPPRPGDGPDYDSIALQITKGNGFAHNWDDPDFRAPYLENKNSKGEPYCEYLFKRHGAGSTTYRPPLVPALMAASYGLIGREFWPIRVMNLLLMSLVCPIIFSILYRRFGVIPGLIGAAWFLADSYIRFYSKEILTESAGCLVSVLVLLQLLRTVEIKTNRAALYLGLITGCGFLVKSVFVFWMPFLALLIYLVCRRNRASWLDSSALRMACLFLVSFFVVSAPWMIRNCVVLGRFEPLGSQGSIGLSSGYSDSAVAAHGLWISPDVVHFFDHFRDQNLTLLESENAKAIYSKKTAIQWCLHHPSKLPRLAFDKVKGLWLPYSRYAALRLWFAAIGFLVISFLRPTDALSLLTILGASTIAVAITYYSDDGRFLLPLVPMLAMLASLGTWSMITCIELGIERLALHQLNTTIKNEA